MTKTLIAILVLAALLRLVSLAVFPSGFNADEAALGYNAYSLLLTAKDEHGHIMPVNLESFGDFKPALYSYLLVPLVKVFGLNELVVRFPSALFGVLAVFLLYVFTKLITGNWKLSIIASLLLAISTWHLHFSRGAWEVNLATTFILLGAIFFVRWLASSKFAHCALCIIFFALSMYVYQSARVIAPALGIGLLVVYHRKFLTHLKQSFLALLILGLVLIPFIISIFSSDAASRINGVGLTADEGPVNFVRELRVQHSSVTQIIAKLLHNRPIIYSLQFIKNYLSHFDGNFLFVNGDVIERNRVPETGLLYFTDPILIIFGFSYLLKIKNYKLKIIFLWLLIAPLASALTFQVPHALRAQNMVIPLTIICAAGVHHLLQQLNHLTIKPFKNIAMILLVFCYLYQFSRYLHQYYVHYPQTYPSAWEYGFKELVAYVRANQDRYQQILVTNKFDQPYSLFLFYLHYPPQQFQDNHVLTVRDKYNFSTVKDFDKYHFTNTSWDQVRDTHGSLIIAAAADLPDVGVNVVKTINFPNGHPAFKIVSN
jgi:4-amino-4-deoxy-L-arabinose transferase-like glycosyltransferase